MTVKDNLLQPGNALHEVIVGAFKAKGTTFHHWCRNNNIDPANARHATHGVWSGRKGVTCLNKIIDGAGRDIVTILYRQRLRLETENKQ